MPATDPAARSPAGLGRRSGADLGRLADAVSSADSSGEPGIGERGPDAIGIPVIGTIANGVAICDSVAIGVPRTVANYVSVAIARTDSVGIPILGAVGIPGRHTDRSRALV